MNETIITAAIAAAVSVFVGLSTAIGNRKRIQLDSAKAADDADLRLKERTDRLRDSLWADVEEKLSDQNAIIDELKGNITAQSAQIKMQSVQIKTQSDQLDHQAVQLERQAGQIERQARQIEQLEAMIAEKDAELAQKDAEIERLKNGGDHKRATL